MKRNILFLVFFLLAAINTNTFGQALSGDYYIPQGANPQGYASLSAAFTDLNAKGCSGTVYFYIDGDLAETGANLLINRNDLSVTNNLIIKPAPGKTPTITISSCTATSGATQYAGFTIRNTNFVTIDGSNSVDGATKDLTFAMNDGTNGRLIINLYENADNITVKNCILKFLAPMSTSANTSGIYANGLAAGVVDNLLINNNTIGDNTNIPYYAVRITGYSTGSVYCSNINTTNNILTAQMRTVYYYIVGTTGNTCSVSNNTISNPSTVITGNSVFGIFLYSFGGTINILNNKIGPLKTKNSTTNGLFGISTLTAQTGAVVNIANNMLYDFYCLNATPNTTPVYGIYAQTGGTYNIYYNSIDVNPVNNTTGIVAVLRFVPTANADIKNNILTNTYNSSTSYGIYWAASVLTSNYNNIYLSGANANFGFSVSARKTLADWQAATSQDANSVSKAVEFISATDLHLKGASLGDIDLAGTPLASVTTDIDDNVRHAEFPYMGADEDLVHPLPVELVGFTALSAGKEVNLNWSTKTEVNSYQFIVERKVSDNWEAIGEVAASGNSNSPKEYTFTDKHLANGKYSYRLKIVDTDGTFEYSNAIEVDIEVVSEYTLHQNYPNPFNPTTTISYQLPVDSKVRLEIFSITGELIGTLVDNYQTSGTYNVQLSTNNYNMASGTYIYRLTANDYVSVKKLVVLK